MVFDGFDVSGSGRGRGEEEKQKIGRAQDRVNDKVGRSIRVAVLGSNDHKYHIEGADEGPVLYSVG